MRSNTHERDGGGLRKGFALAATPLFLLMTVVTAPSSGLALLCAPAVMGGLSEMQIMYLLMAFVHCAPWWVLLRRILKPDGDSQHRPPQSRDLAG